MARVCDLCGKTSLKGNLVARGIGNRATRRTIHNQVPNLRVVRTAVNEGGNKIMLRICASCLKRLKKEKRDMAEAAEVEAKVLAATA